MSASKTPPHTVPNEESLIEYPCIFPIKVMGKECGYFTDLASGEILDVWDNPWTGERCEVFAFLNDQFRGSLGLTIAFVSPRTTRPPRP